MVPTTSAPAVRASVPNSPNESSTLHQLSLSSCSTATRKACSILPREDVSIRRPCFAVMPLHLNMFYCFVAFIVALDCDNARTWLPRGIQQQLDTVEGEHSRSPLPH